MDRHAPETVVRLKNENRAHCFPSFSLPGAPRGSEGKHLGIAIFGPIRHGLGLGRSRFVSFRAGLFGIESGRIVRDETGLERHPSTDAFGNQPERHGRKLAPAQDSIDVGGELHRASVRKFGRAIRNG